MARWNLDSRVSPKLSLGERVHASILPASAEISFSADKPVSRTHTQLSRPIHGPRKVIRDHREHIGRANIWDGLFNAILIVSMIALIHVW